MKKYGIKLDNGRGDFLKSMSEHTGKGNLKPVSFDSMAEAELYAQNFEIKNFTIEELT